jgi:SRSO17 transposase
MWWQGTKGALSARFAMARVRVGDGPTWGNNRHLPGDEVWLVGEWHASGERKFYLSNLPLHTTWRALAGTIEARWACEQAQRQMKEELDLDHFEGRSWTGLHRHALMTCITCAYLEHLAEPDRTDCGEKGAGPPGSPPSPSLPVVRQAIISRLFVAIIPPVRCPYCRHRFRLPADLKVLR